jgi:hypothetical protein
MGVKTGCLPGEVHPLLWWLRAAGSAELAASLQCPARSAHGLAVCGLWGHLVVCHCNAAFLYNDQSKKGKVNHLAAAQDIVAPSCLESKSLISS